MGKILYPVGTGVQVREGCTLPGNYPADRSRKVLRYIKGSDKPYVLSDSSGDETIRHFSVAEIRHYRALQTETPDVTISGGVAKVNLPDVYTKAEIKELMLSQAQVYDAEIARLMGLVDSKLADMHNHILNDTDSIARDVVHEHMLTEDE